MTVPGLLLYNILSGAPALTSVSTSAKQKPALDESSFQQLLAAAYVVQEHNASLRAKNLQPEAAPAPSPLSELESLVRAGGLDAADSIKLIADQVLKMMGAAGVSISLIRNGYLDCVAESGAPSNIPGSSLASHSLVATEWLKAGAIFQSADAHTDIRLDASLCGGLGAGSLVAAPVFRFGDLAGLIEVRWARENAFKESDVDTCRDVAGLITEIVERPSAPAGKMPDSEGDSATAMPNTADSDVQRNQTVVTSQVSASNEAAGKNPTMMPAQRCRVCGRPFGADEAFCGYCSMPRTASAPSKELQSKWASLWYIQKAQGTLEKPAEISAPAPAAAPEPVSSTRSPLLDSLAAVSERSAPTEARSTDQFSYFMPLPEKHVDSPEIDLLEEHVSIWSRFFRSAREKLRPLDMVLILLAAALTFGVVSAWPTSAKQLTWFQSVMVRLGFARGPVRPHSYTGDPASRVWVDPHTGLYYCPGSGLYGKTSEGYYAAQREAQQQHIAPAAGLACQ